MSDPDGRTAPFSLTSFRQYGHALLTASLLLLAAPSLADGFILKGIVTHIRDADTIEVAGVPVRLSGVTADELGTARGKAAKAFMRDLVRGQTVTCTLTGETTHDRQVGHCAVNGYDLGMRLIEAGMAGRCARYDPDGLYRPVQQQAGPYAGLMPKYCQPR
jgi:endonuclease YncB( thermonuclease family)